MKSWFNNCKAPLTGVILFFIFTITINADIFLECDETAFPGGLIRVYAVGNEKIQNLFVLLNTEEGKKIEEFHGFKYFPAQIFAFKNNWGHIECMAAIISTGSTLKQGKYKVAVFVNNEATCRKEFPIVIKKKQFTSETIPLNKNLSELRSGPSKRRDKEAKELQTLLSTFTKENIFTESQIIKPIAAQPCYITSTYGDIRKFVYDDGGSAGSIHNGIDYGAAKGSLIFSCAAGRVAFAGDRLITGNSVIIEHLPGLYSLYYHLDTLLVTENMFLPKGAKIGTLGSTGLATGPHLHWEIRNQKLTVDPDFLIANPMVDKDKIISIIKTRFTDMAEGR